MPTYEYRCNACGSRFEEFQKMSDDPVEICPECGEPEAERLMSAGAGVLFKGSGFYETDYKKKDGGRSSGGSGGSGNGDSGNGEKGSGAEASAGDAGASDSTGDGGEGES